jgi:hypothetical protein
MPESSLKGEAHKIVDGLPDDATWEDLQYEIYVRQSIEVGLKDLREGRKVSHEEILREFGLQPS